jgi:hypothetical protein
VCYADIGVATSSLCEGDSESWEVRLCVLGIQVGERAGLSRERGYTTQGVAAAGRAFCFVGGGGGCGAPRRAAALTPGRKGQPGRLKRTSGVELREGAAPYTALGPKKRPSPARHFNLRSRTFSQLQLQLKLKLKLNRKRAPNGFTSALGPFPVWWWLV